METLKQRGVNLDERDKLSLASAMPTLIPAMIKDVATADGKTLVPDYARVLVVACAVGAVNVAVKVRFRNQARPADNTHQGASAVRRSARGVQAAKYVGRPRGVPCAHP